MPDPGPSDFLVVRQTLEEVTSTEIATSVIFEALESWGAELPKDGADILRWSKGPLRDAMGRRLASDKVDRVIQRIHLALGVEDVPELTQIEVDIDLADNIREEITQSDLTTKAIIPLTADETVSIVVVGNRPAFGAHLEASLGSGRVRVRTVSTESELRHASFSENPVLVVVDATTPSPLGIAELAAALDHLPEKTMRIWWGADSDFSQSALPILEESTDRLLELPLSEGIEPLLDLILARYHT